MRPVTQWEIQRRAEETKEKEGRRIQKVKSPPTRPTEPGSGKKQPMKQRGSRTQRPALPAVESLTDRRRRRRQTRAPEVDRQTDRKSRRRRELFPSGEATQHRPSELPTPSRAVTCPTCKRDNNRSGRGARSRRSVSTSTRHPIRHCGSKQQQRQLDAPTRQDSLEQKRTGYRRASRRAR
jgi:hypothetical protein